MAIFPEQNTPIFNLAVDEAGRAYFLETVRWTKFLAIIGFILVGLIMIGGVSMLLFSPAFGTPVYGIISGPFIFALYVAMGALYIYPVTCLYRFSTLIKRAIVSNNQAQFNNALRYQRNLFKFLGILTILLIVLYAVAIIFAIVATATKF